MRLFGVPNDHVCRLENHGSLRSEGFRGPQWKISVAGRSHLAVVQFRLLDGSDPSRALVTKKGEQSVGIGDPMDVRALWYLVPRPPYGWDIVSAQFGLRLNAADNAVCLELSPALAGLTHWEILRFGRTKGQHRSHFWLPPFFAQAFCTKPREHDAWGVMEPVVANHLVAQENANSPSVMTITDAEGLAACNKKSTCSALAINNDGTVTTYSGWVVQSTKEEPDPLDNELGRMNGCTVAMAEREHQLFGDTRPRGVNGDIQAVRGSLRGLRPDKTGEYNARWSLLGRPSTGMVLFRRRRPDFRAP